MSAKTPKTIENLSTFDDVVDAWNVVPLLGRGSWGNQPLNCFSKNFFILIAGILPFSFEALSKCYRR